MSINGPFFGDEMLSHCITVGWGYFESWENKMWRFTVKSLHTLLGENSQMSFWSIATSESTSEEIVRQNVSS